MVLRLDLVLTYERREVYGSNLYDYIWGNGALGVIDSDEAEDGRVNAAKQPVLFTEKCLSLKEKIGVTRRRTTEHFHDTVALRRQEAVVSRLQSATEQSGAEPAQDLKSTQE